MNCYWRFPSIGYCLRRCLAVFFSFFFKITVVLILRFDSNRKNGIECATQRVNHDETQPWMDECMMTTSTDSDEPAIFFLKKWKKNKQKWPASGGHNCRMNLCTTRQYFIYWDFYAISWNSRGHAVTYLLDGWLWLLPFSTLCLVLEILFCTQVTKWNRERRREKNGNYL